MTIGRRVTLILGLVGLIVAGVTVFLFYQLTELAGRYETFNFTVWYVVTQELTLFWELALQVLRRQSTPNSAVQSYADTTVVILYNSVSIATVLLFNLYLLPHGAAPKTYYAICLAETGLAVALWLLMVLPVLIQQGRHSSAIHTRAQMIDLIAVCNRLRVNAELRGWTLSPSSADLAERVRFSESLRGSEQILGQFVTKLDQLEMIVSGHYVNGGDHDQAQQLIHEMMILTT
jgi:hypothetical protein